MKQKLAENLLYIAGITVMSIVIVLPYFNSGYFPTHDGEWAVVRLGDMFRTVRDFQFPPRYSGALNFGYGYPLFNFAYPFPYYLGLLLYLPLQSFVLSIKVIFAGSVFLSGLFMYLASSKLWNNRLSGFVSALLYLFLPYKMVDLYVRGSIGESIAFVLFPLIFLFSLRLFDSAFSRINVVMLSVLIGILVITHNIMTILFVPVLFIFVAGRIVWEKRFDVAQSFLLSLVIGAGLSFYFWFPALYEKGYIALSQIPIADRSLYFVNLYQLIVPSWGFAPPTQANGFSYQIGIGQVFAVLSVLAILVISFIRRSVLTPAKFYAFLLLALSAICFLMMFSFTDFIWKNVPLLSEINYPWTMLSQLGFLSSIIAGFMVLNKGFIKYIAIGLGVLSIGLTIGYAKPESYNNKSDEYFLTNEATTTSSDELMPIWVKDKPTFHYDKKVEVIEGDAVINNLTFNSKSLYFTYTASSNSKFRINTIYYPGWRAFVNTTEVKIDYRNPRGVIEIEGDQFGDKVYLQFSETLSRTIANGISIFSALILLFILLRPLLLFKR